MPVLKKCAVCEKGLILRPAIVMERNYCSRKCQSIGMSKKVERTCGWCEKTFLVKKAKSKEINFCSHECYWKDKKKEVAVECLNCGASVLKKPCTVQEKNFCNMFCRDSYTRGVNHPNYKKVEDRFCLKCNKLLSHTSLTRDRIRYCSQSCAKSGENHWSWKGGIWIYPSEFEKKIRHEIRKRDGERCASCGTKKYGKKNLHVHHIDMNKKNSNPENLITLCAKCHQQEHRKISMRVKEEKSPSFK